MFVSAGSGIASTGASAASASDSSHITSCYSGRLEEEFDSTEREAEVFLFSRILEGNTIFKDAKESKFHHWVFVAHFLRGDRWIAYEAFESKEKLVPAISNERPKGKGKYYKVDRIITSPLKLREHAAQNEMNGQPYRAAADNCQEWVKNFAKSISEKLYEKMKDFKTFKEAHPFCACVLESSSASSNTFMGSSRKSQNFSSG